MQECKYTFQDWEDGTIKTSDLWSLVLSEELDEEIYDRIAEEQDKAYLKLLSDAFEVRKSGFLDSYSSCFVKQDYLNIAQIKNIEAYKEHMLEHEEIVSDAINGIVEARKLTAKEVKLCLSSDTSEANTYEEYDELITDFMLLRGGVFSYILNSNFLEWLYWFREQQKSKRTEHSINLSASINKDEFKKLKSYKWPNLFKDSKQADIILKLIEEHLSSTGQWLTTPKVRHLVALCIELESKGYFKSSNAITNPVKAAAFSAQFDVQLTDKNFQPQKRNDAEDYREHFQHIPPYQHTP